ncbi:MAG TPA: hypothetical protein DCP62_05290 [Erysipelotrichaceae bacterium]|nr:hypothetical protein [Erysipelotrichaceae bacterium]
MILALTYIGYVALYFFIEANFIKNPQHFQMDKFRSSYMMFMILIYFLIDRSKIHDLFKAAALVSPLSMVLVVVVLRFYDRIPYAYLGIAFVLAGLLAWLILSKKPWYYYLSALITLGVSIAYAWP